MSSESAQARIYAKLAEAASGTDLHVRTHADLDGASVVGPVVEAYVVAVSRGGFQIEMWRGSGRDPYKIERFGGLDEAISTAVAAALRHPRKTSGRTQGGMMKVIDTDTYSLRLRAAAFNAVTGQLLVSELAGSNQEEDLTDPPNCGGYGRIRHFMRQTAAGWPSNLLPMVPACAALGLPPVEMIRAQVFQNAACNWRCWYCFVPFDLLSANKKRSAWFTAAELVDMYLAVPDRPPVLDLSGGQPDLIPEWAPRTLRALDACGVADVYVWSDDNLSNDYFWRYLKDDDRALLASHPRYGRVACFKGFDADSFMFNTAAAPELFERQFELFARLAATGMDVYAYATFTTPSGDGIAAKMARFVDRLQQISEYLPLRLVPLQIEKWGPVADRMREPHHAALEHQERAIQAWWQELDKRFTATQMQTPINEVPLTAVGSPQ